MSNSIVLNNFVKDLSLIPELTIYTSDNIDTQFIFDCNEEFTLAFFEGILSINVRIIDNKPDIVFLMLSNSILYYPELIQSLKDLKEKYKDL